MSVESVYHFDPVFMKAKQITVLERRDESDIGLTRVLVLDDKGRAWTGYLETHEGDHAGALEQVKLVGVSLEDQHIGKLREYVDLKFNEAGGKATLADVMDWCDGARRMYGGGSSYDLHDWAVKHFGTA